jgi:uncharacterized protein (DUF433 family)
MTFQPDREIARLAANEAHPKRVISEHYPRKSFNHGHRRGQRVGYAAAMREVFGSEITCDSEVMGGSPCLKGTRFPAAMLFAEVADATWLKAFAEDRGLDLNQLMCVFRWIAATLEKKELV